MPLYEYECGGCKKVLEVMQKFSDAPLSACPECGGGVTKLMSLGSFSLKGSGWYATDYKRKPSCAAAENTAGAPASPPCGTAACPASK